MAGRRLGRRFGWLWAAYSVSTFGTYFAFDAFTVVAVLVLNAAPVEVSRRGRRRGRCWRCRSARGWSSAASGR